MAWGFFSFDAFKTWDVKKTVFITSMFSIAYVSCLLHLHKYHVYCDIVTITESSVRKKQTDARMRSLRRSWRSQLPLSQTSRLVLVLFVSSTPKLQMALLHQDGRVFSCHRALNWSHTRQSDWRTLLTIYRHVLTLTSTVIVDPGSLGQRVNDFVSLTSNLLSYCISEKASFRLSGFCKKKRKKRKVKHWQFLLWLPLAFARVRPDWRSKIKRRHTHTYSQTHTHIHWPGY